MQTFQLKKNQVLFSKHTVMTQFMIFHVLCCGAKGATKVAVKTAFKENRQFIMSIVIVGLEVDAVVLSHLVVLKAILLLFSLLGNRFVLRH